MTDIEQKRINNLLDWYQSCRANYLDFSNVVLERIRKATVERGILVASSSCRAKELSSLEAKCKKTVVNEATQEHQLKYTDPKSQIMDFAGVRIVAYLKSDVQSICRIVESLFEIDYENSGDKRTILSENEIGYLSVHYIVSLKEYPLDCKKFLGYKCEVQIRTILQDAWAQIFHDRLYKNKLSNVIPNNDLRRNTNLVAGTLELIDNEIDSLVNTYDSMCKNNIWNSSYQELLDMNITPESLEKYCNIKFVGQVNRYYNAKAVIANLRGWGFEVIRDIDNIVQEKFVDVVKKVNQITIDKLITYILIVSDATKYFALSHDRRISVISQESFDLLDEFVDMRNICEKYNIPIDE